MKSARKRRFAFAETRILINPIFMNLWKFAVASGLLIASLTVAGCTATKNGPDCHLTNPVAVNAYDPPKAPECSLPPASPTPAWKTVIGDGIYDVGTAIPAGRWESVGLPMQNKDCAWWIAPDPSVAPGGADLPSYNDFKYGYRYKIAITLLKGQVFVTQFCGEWELTEVR